MQHVLEVQREINGGFQKVGDLWGDADGIRFAYDQAYLQSPGAVSIATGFPLGAAPALATVRCHLHHLLSCSRQGDGRFAMSESSRR